MHNINILKWVPIGLFILTMGGGCSLPGAGDSLLVKSAINLGILDPEEIRASRQDAKAAQLRKLAAVLRGEGREAEAEALEREAEALGRAGP